MIASNYFSIPFRLNWNYKIKTNLTVDIAVLQTVLGALVICVILISYCIKQKSLVRIANRLIIIEHDIDRLYDLYYPLQRQRIFYTMIIVCILKICLLILLLFTQIVTGHTDPISWLTDVLPTFHVGWLLIQYFLLVTVIQTDFADVNRLIQSLTRTNAPDLRLQSLYQTRRIIINNSTVYQLLQLRDVHCHLCKISEDVSSFYSLSVLFGIVFLFLTLIYNGYYFLSFLLMTDNILNYSYSIIDVIVWIILLIYPIFLLTNKITRILIEMNKAGNLVHDLLNCAIEKETNAELKKFSLQLLHRKIQFTANGYFTLDNTFLYSLTGTVVTYLVILVQFQMIKTTGNIVHDLLNCAIGKETKTELKKFSLQLLHRKIQFTANGYFILDNTFLHSLIGTMMTYLVILVQFQMTSLFSSVKQHIISSCNSTKRDLK
ncbi:Putative gustatory receptor 28b [Atta colombica]|uniref:Gustatory receptor n=1 Tax=Atta colombica TaxID=520822 RepID=A0A195BQV7_9HYME|nr:Putative gustatory receptor 28b [Atta colombica]